MKIKFCIKHEDCPDFIAGKKVPLISREHAHGYVVIVEAEGEEVIFEHRADKGVNKCFVRRVEGVQGLYQATCKDEKFFCLVSADSDEEAVQLSRDHFASLEGSPVASNLSFNVRRVGTSIWTKGVVGWEW